MAKGGRNCLGQPLKTKTIKHVHQRADHFVQSRPHSSTQKRAEIGMGSGGGSFKAEAVLVITLFKQSTRVFVLHTIKLVTVAETATLLDS